MAELNLVRSQKRARDTLGWFITQPSLTSLQMLVFIKLDILIGFHFSCGLDVFISRHESSGTRGCALCRWRAERQMRFRNHNQKYVSAPDTGWTFWLNNFGSA